MQLNTILKALWIGSTMTIPGVSGGTMAVIVGIYEQLISSINGLLKDPKKNLPFIFQFLIGAGTGFILFARLITSLLESPTTGPMLKLFFIIIILAGIPFLYKKTGIQALSFSHLLYVLSGAFIIYLISLIPEGTFSESTGITGLLFQFICGIIIAIALVLPGISVSHMLLILGIYKSILASVYTFQWLSLIPLILGILIGTFTTTNILEKALTKHPDKVYLIIIGFVASSLTMLI